MKLNQFVLLCLLIAFLGTSAIAQMEGQEKYRFAFYNLENFLIHMLTAPAITMLLHLMVSSAGPLTVITKAK